MSNNYRKIDISGLTEIGSGATSIVYKLTEDKIIKVYNFWMKFDEILREYNTSKAVYEKGVPSPKPYEVVEVTTEDKELRYGVIYELIEADTLADIIGNNPNTLKEHAIKCAHMLLDLHKIQYNEGELPDCRNTWWDMCREGLVKYISSKQESELELLLKNIPVHNTFIHGDFYPRNIMMRGSKMLLIDVGEASIGHPFFDLASIYMSCVILPKRSVAGHLSKSTMTRQMWEDFYGCFMDIYLDEYLRGRGDDSREEVESVISLFGNLRYIMTYSLIPGRSKEERIEIIEPIISSICDNRSRVEEQGVLM